MTGNLAWSKGDAIRGPAQRAVLQDRFCRQRLEHRPGNHPSIRNAETVAKFERSAANNDLLVLQPVERCGIATQHVDIGHLGNGAGGNAEIYQERRLALLVLTGQNRAHGWMKLAIERLAVRIAPNQAVPLYGDVHHRRPGLLRKLRQRTIDVDR
jgi:hypothetical protein